jgi:hypothetical protein
MQGRPGGSPVGRRAYRTAASRYVGLSSTKRTATPWARRGRIGQGQTHNGNAMNVGAGLVPAHVPAACPFQWKKSAATKTVARALCGTRDNDSAAAGRSTAMESPLRGAGRDDRPRGPSEVARRQDRPSPGAARRPLPARERRLFSPVQLRCANRHSLAPSHVDSSPSPWLGRGRG